MLASHQPIEEIARRKKSSTMGQHWLIWLPIPVVLLAVALLAWLRLDAAANPPLVIPALNIFFLSLIPLVVSALAAKTFLERRDVPILFLGCGTLTLSLGAALAVSPFLGPEPNSMVSVYNTAAWLAGLLHTISALASVSARSQRLRSDWPVLPVLYSAVLLLIILLVILVRVHLWPVYFEQGEGATAVGLAVLWTTAPLFALSAVVIGIISGGGKPGFRHWYSAGLGLIAAGLIGVSLQTSIGDPLNWLGRTSQYLGSLYMLIAVAVSIKQSGTWKLSLEQALKESESRYQSLVNLSPDAILVNAGGEVVFANPAAARLLGATSPEELIGMDLAGLVHPDQWGPLAKRIARNASILAAPGEVKLRRLDGSHVETEAVGGKVEFAGRPAIQLVVRDITERKRAEVERQKLLEEIQKHAQLLDAIFQAEPGGMAVAVGRDLVFAYANPAYRRQTPHPEIDPIGKPLEEIWPTREEFQAAAVLGGVYETGEPFDAQRYSRTFPDGTTHYFSFHLRRIPWDEDHAVVVVLWDTTEIEESALLAERAVKLRDEFISMASHELKTPVTSLQGYSQLLTRQYERTGSVDLERLVKALRQIRLQSAKLARLTEQMLDLSRLETGKLVLARRDVDLTSLVRSVMDTMQIAHPECNLELLDDSPLVASVDPIRIEQVVTNLLDNAIKFSPDGSPVVVEITRDCDGWAGIVVRDYGIGIPQDRLEHIFEAFYQAHPERHLGGMGIGLHIGREMVELHGGSINVEQPPDGGSRFAVRLPLADH